MVALPRNIEPDSEHVRRQRSISTAKGETPEDEPCQALG